ncbi:MAG: hypothetical protein SFV32_11980 [Opitutaceae bacterium]|nr:hypothetical protein [Opitutaceae bacterium]
MNASDPRWKKLVAKATFASSAQESLPGDAWATRVAAQALAARAPDDGWILAFSVRALGVAAVLAVAAISVNVPQWSTWVDEEVAAIDALPEQQEVLDLS